jgi:hypothetical protein
MFRFTIRELVLLTLVVAMGVGWWIDRSRLREQNRTLRDEQKVLRFEALRAQELAGKIILPSARPRAIPRRD